MTVKDELKENQEIIYNPVYYRFLSVNSAFEKMTDLSRSEVVGQRVTDLFKDIKHSSFDWIGVYGKVAQTAESTRFESYFECARPLVCGNGLQRRTGTFCHDFS